MAEDYSPARQRAATGVLPPTFAPSTVAPSGALQGRGFAPGASRELLPSFGCEAYVLATDRGLSAGNGRRLQRRLRDRWRVPGGGSTVPGPVPPPLGIVRPIAGVRTLASM